VIWEGGFEPFGRDYASAQSEGLFLRHPGQWNDSAWNGYIPGELLYNVHRWYNPELGRYMRPDPIPPGKARSVSLFAYAAANPLRYLDPLGLLLVCCNEWDKQNLQGILNHVADLQDFVITGENDPGPLAISRAMDMKQTVILATLLAPAVATTVGNAEDRQQTTACPHGTFQNAEALHKPLPSGGSLHDQCKGFLGSPVVKYVIGIDGRVHSPTFLRRTNCEKVDAELRRCLSGWRFKPATCDGQPVESEDSLVVNWGYGPPPTTDEDQCPPYEPADEQWQALLEAGLERDVEARERVETAVVEGVSEAVRKLAEVLLEEWEWPPDHPRAVQPRAIWYRHPEPDDLPPDARHSLFPSIGVEGVVTPEGAFVDTRLKESTGNERLDRLILDAAATAGFRPAREGPHYVEHRSMLVFHWGM
jgi:RHS repeat-associated protein